MKDFRRQLLVNNQLIYELLKVYDKYVDWNDGKTIPQIEHWRSQWIHEDQTCPQHTHRNNK